jgi:hypothetical protein
MWLEYLALLDGTLVLRQVGVGGKAQALLLGQVSRVRHRLSDGHDAQAHAFEEGARCARYLRLANARPRTAHGQQRLA